MTILVNFIKVEDGVQVRVLMDGQGEMKSAGIFSDWVKAIVTFTEMANGHEFDIVSDHAIELLSAK